MPDKYKFTRAEANALRRDLEKILKYGDEREFMQVLRMRGIMDEDPRCAKSAQMLFKKGRGTFHCGLEFGLLCHLP
jgi:hypothetical protein